ncbi:DDB1- and CUL4-associated factor 6-like isoform X2 [Daphnia carinata]|uniref:DDB1- and CUL4-associated factor 6-like isoform X2 n=1 Tax=Daphnia carinata TaxID=120202 RepID=UPI002579B5FF|nr:DDB1- and CUL4-associated factor 6-like isoform X2 [Daphnia carinata]
MFRSILSAQFNLDTRLDLHRAVTDSQWTIRHLSKFKILAVHAGCVNTIQWNLSGDLILSGSDDRKLAVTRWIDGHVINEVKSLHKTNIMSAKFLPQSGDRQAVSCSGDGVIMVSDLENGNSSLQGTFKCHHGPVYEVVTVESEPNTFLSVGEDGTARWFDLRASRNCTTTRCKENILFICQSPLSSAAINPVLPHEFVIGTSDSQVYVMDRRKLSTGSLTSPTQSIVSSMKVASFAGHSYRTTSVQFSPEGDQVLASFSGEGVYLFDVKDPASYLPLSIPKCELEEQFSGNPDTNSPSRRRARQGHSFKRVRLRGDWSDTGPSAGMNRTAPDIGQARPTVHEGFMQRMADVLRSMTSLNSPSVTSPPSPFENPTEEPPFLIAEANAPPNTSSVRGETNSRDEIDFVTYESLGRSENLPENQLENMESNAEDSSINFSEERSETFPHFRNRQDSEQSSSGFSLPREPAGCDEIMDAQEEEDTSPNSDMLYQPIAKMKYEGHRNSRTAINEASFWGRCHVMSGSDCGHVFIWNRQTGAIVSVLQADTRVVNRVRPHPHEPMLATSGIDYDIKLWAPSSGPENNINIEELVIRNARMLEETRDTITIPASYMIRMLASMTRFRQGTNRANSD